jgi:hypothetical protein
MIVGRLVAMALVLIVFSYDEFLLASSLTFVDATRTLPVAISLFQVSASLISGRWRQPR